MPSSEGCFHGSGSGRMQSTWQSCLSSSGAVSTLSLPPSPPEVAPRSPCALRPWVKPAEGGTATQVALPEREGTIFGFCFLSLNNTQGPAAECCWTRSPLSPPSLVWGALFGQEEGRPQGGGGGWPVFLLCKAELELGLLTWQPCG